MNPLRHRSPYAVVLGALVTLCAAALVGYSLLTSAATRLIHTEPSEFAPVFVFEEYGERCMNFDQVEDSGRQTCFDLDEPNKMVFAYTRMMTSALFVKPDPRRILIVGLGGATMPRALEKILPDAVIDSVEIDPAVVRVAERFFGYKQGPRQRVFIEDGRAFVERVHKQGQKYDMVMLDAFDTDYIPPHLLTRQFLQLVHEILEPDGVLVANTFTNSHMYDQESATYAAVFGDFFNLRAGNRVIIAALGGLPDDETLKRNASAFAGRLAPYGIDVTQALQRFSRERDWDQDASVLVD